MNSITNPDMTHQEASFHQAVAGQRAAKQAAEKGNDPNQVQALAEAALGGKSIHGVTFQRPSAYSAFAIPAIAQLFEKRGIGPMENTGLFLFSFVQPREAYELAVVQKDEAAIEALLEKAQALVLLLEYAEHIEAARTWCNEAFDRLHGVKKPSPEPSPPSQPSPASREQETEAVPVGL